MNESRALSDSQAFQSRQFRGFRIEAPKGVTSQDQGRRDVEQVEKIRVRAGFHSPANNLSARRVCSGGSTFGNIRLRRARKFGSFKIRSGPESGRIVYVRPLRRRILTAPSWSQASRITAGARSSSRTVNVFMSDIMSAFMA